MKIGICSKCNKAINVAFGLNKWLCADCAVTALIDKDIALKASQRDKLTDFNKLADNCHKQAVKSGFYAKEREFLLKYNVNEEDKEFFMSMSISQKLMLIVSELAEKLEAMRKGKKADIEVFKKFDLCKDETFDLPFKEYIKDTPEDELIDALLRILDLSVLLEIDLNSHITWKMKYNSLRCNNEGLRHGKSF